MISTQKRFEKTGHRAHRVELNSTGLEFDEYSKLHPNDLELIVEKIAKDYEKSKADFIYVSGMHIEDRTFRSAICSSLEYKMEK